MLIKVPPQMGPFLFYGGLVKLAITLDLQSGIMGSKPITIHMKKYSNKLNTIFSLFLKMNRSGIITFCGEGIKIVYDINGPNGKDCFINFENGVYKQGKTIVTKHPNLVKSVLIGKKGWGLWMKEWSQGIRQGLFTKREILEEFEKKNITLPESFLQEFNNLIYK